MTNQTNFDFADQPVFAIGQRVRLVRYGVVVRTWVLDDGRRAYQVEVPPHIGNRFGGMVPAMETELEECES